MDVSRKSPDSYYPCERLHQRQVYGPQISITNAEVVREIDEGIVFGQVCFKERQLFDIMTIPDCLVSYKLQSVGQFQRPDEIIVEGKRSEMRDTITKNNFFHNEIFEHRYALRIMRITIHFELGG